MVTISQQEFVSLGGLALEWGVLRNRSQGLRILSTSSVIHHFILKMFVTLNGIKCSAHLEYGGPDDEEVDGEWLDVDAGWRKKRVEITVPFHRRNANPWYQPVYMR